ncbi:MAG: tRNA-dihydrouridine synthase, partial [Bacteroidota bacterium]
IETPDRARNIIQAAKRGAGDLPVSVKTRVGYNHDQLDEWLPVLLSAEPAVVTIHARTRKELSKVPAEWERVARAVAIRDAARSSTLIFGNGDVLSRADAYKKATQSGADGVMVGRALFGNPWFFHPTKRLPVSLTALPTSGVDRDSIVTTDTSEVGLEYIDLPERLRVLVEHTQLFEELLSFKNFAIMKKHYKAYVSGFPGAAELRAELMLCNDGAAVASLVESWLQNRC